MSEHTPTPWITEKVPSGPKVYSTGAGDPAICQLFDKYGEPFFDADANAAFIVKAANNHEALIDFMRWVDSWVSNPVGSYSVDALDGLFGMTRDRIEHIRRDVGTPGRQP